MREGIDDKAFPEQGAKVSIHSDGSFEGLGCVLANTNLNVLTAVFYWFTLKRDEPFVGAGSGMLFDNQINTFIQQFINRLPGGLSGNG